MNTKPLRAVFGIVVVIALGAFVWMSSSTPVAATIAVVAPQGGEVWDTGSTHTISWTTSGVPATHNVSVTIQRIPPPPLQEEGQEFDPLIFTNLPNTGTAEWTIANQYPTGTYVLGLTAYESIPVTNPISVESQPFDIVHPKIAIDLYPLYTGANWNRSETESVTIGTTTYSGASMASVSLDAGMNPASVVTPFTKYYDKLLKERGWHVANDLAAGGHVGGQTGYRNGPGTILVGFHIDYQTKPENAPTECPCDVTFSLFSSGVTN